MEEDDDDDDDYDDDDDEDEQLFGFNGAVIVSCSRNTVFNKDEVLCS